MKHLAIIILSIILSASCSYAENSKSTICRSSTDEIKFKELAGPNVQVLAVCPKKGIYFVEIMADINETIDFKEKIKKSDLKVFEIKTWKEQTKIGSQVLMVKFNY